MLSSSVYVRSRPGRVQVASRSSPITRNENALLFSLSSSLFLFLFFQKGEDIFVTTCIVFSIRRIPKRGFLLQKIRRKEEARDARKHNNQHVKTAVLKETNVIDRI